MTLEGHAGHVSGVAFSSDGEMFASCSHDQTVRVWDLQGKLRMVLDSFERSEELLFPESMLPGGPGLGMGVRVALAELTGQPVPPKDRSGGRFTHVWFSSDSKQLFGRTWNKRLYVWETSHFQLIRPKIKIAA